MKYEQKIVEVTTAELRQLLANGSAYIFDARLPLEYAVSHIPGALNVAPKFGVEMAQSVSDVAEIERMIPAKMMPIVLYGNGLFCDQSQRLSTALLAAGFSHVRCYQLGIPTWRALVGLTQIELAGVRYVLKGDQTAVFIDVRSPAAFAAGSLAGAVNLVDKEDVTKAKDDSRLPMHDHNTRIIVFGGDGAQARTRAEEIARNAFHNVAFYDGAFDQLRQGLSQ